uniref:NADH dehydrogenase subunit 5 n=1 Tax=Calliobdella nodulifera TaxID=3385569 RepID=UPI0020794F17|nr:NADH dehydrogenase subunit 5 [Notostomum cyclostomum]URP31059.1 NADH dehydrogenase subunit 5 [Notostomum cyclostomum]
MFNNKYINMNLYKFFMFMSMFIFMLSIYLMYYSKTIIIEWEFFNLFNIMFMLTFMLDPMGVMFSSVVLFITSNVMKFSIMYMSEEKFINRFNYLLIMFVMSMNLLIFIPNMLVLLLGWDGLGIVSFILVIYYQNSKSLSAGLITILTNRLGDIAIIICIILTLNQGHWNINCMWMNIEYKYQIMLILIAAMTKSAQVPFSSWLPAAMAAPTPVSALVHSSTLVTAGVFILIRFYNFIMQFDMFNKILMYSSIITTLVASMCAIMENDMKKIVALSTLSQLGLMMTTLSLGMLNMCFMHMVVHAMFKALLFLCVGILINYNSHSQDLRWVGNLAYNMPVTSSCMLISILSMSGFPFLSAFYTKDLIMEYCVCYMNNMFMMIFMYVSIGLTMFYSLRMIFNIMLNSTNMLPYNMMNEEINLMKTLILMTTPSVCLGSMMSWIMINDMYTMSLTLLEMLMPLTIIMFSFMLAYLMSTMYMSFNIYILNLSSNMWFMIFMSTQMFMNLFLMISKNYLKLLDQSWLEMYSGEGLFNNLMFLTNNSLNTMSFNPVKLINMSIITLMILVSMYT